MELHRGEWSQAAEDVLAIYRLAALEGHGGYLIQWLVARSQHMMASEALVWLAASPELRSSAGRTLLARLSEEDEIPNDFTVERMDGLARLLRMRELDSSEEWRELLGPELPEIYEIPAGLYQVPASAVDWEEALRILNRSWDLVQAFVDASTSAERARILSDLEKEHEWTWRAKHELEGPRLTRLIDKVEDDAEARLELTRAFVAGTGLLLTHLRSIVTLNESRAQYQLARVSLALAIFRAERGGWPSHVEELVPDYLSAPPPREANGYVFRYTTDASAVAIVATPKDFGKTGVRGFCWDGGGGMLIESAPTLVNGRCHWSLQTQEASAADADAPVGKWVMAGLALLIVATTVYLGRRSLRGRLVIVAVLAWTLAVSAVLSRALDRPAEELVRFGPRELAFLGAGVIGSFLVLSAVLAAGLVLFLAIRKRCPVLVRHWIPLAVIGAVGLLAGILRLPDASFTKGVLLAVLFVGLCPYLWMRLERSRPSIRYPLSFVTAMAAAFLVMAPICYLVEKLVVPKYTGMYLLLAAVSLGAVLSPRLSRLCVTPHALVLLAGIPWGSSPSPGSRHPSMAASLFSSRFSCRSDGSPRRSTAPGWRSWAGRSQRPSL